MKILVTGGAGFIGSNFIRYLLQNLDGIRSVINVDKLTYAGNLENLSEVETDPRYIFIKADIVDTQGMDSVFSEHQPETVVHFAAESHVDRSIHDASPFIHTNVLGTQVLLDKSLKYNVARFLHVSTDEVYGSLGEDDPAFTEEHPIDPSSPYSASKAASDMLVMACHRTHGLNTTVTRCSNNYGPFQFPEKLIPLMIHNALANEPLPVYGDGRNIRDWIFVEDHCRALAAVMGDGRSGSTYNIGGNAERRNLDVVKTLLGILGKPESLIRFVKDRPGHDWRYAIDSSRVAGETGWNPSLTFEEGLERTVKWYLDNQSWTERITSGQYLDYYSKMYSERLDASL